MQVIGVCLLLGYFAALRASGQDLPASVNAELPSLMNTYKDVHAHPELSEHEERTSALVAAELRKAGYTVTEHVGKYSDGRKAFGVVGILKNGPGKQLLIRTDLDALPIAEETGVAYASRVRTTSAAGQDVGVMHACGHDVHIATLIGTARMLARFKDKWHGTVMLIGQPAEETVTGARAMLADQLYERFGTPDFAVALHDSNLRAAGTVSVTSGFALASATSLDVTLRGIGGHGAAPHLTKDPVVMAAEFIMELQTIVSRQENPRDPAVITVGMIQGGSKRNIIPNEVKLSLTTRAFSDAARQIIVDGIRRTAQGVALAAGVPADLAPVVTILENESTPALYNDPALTARVHDALTGALGSQKVFDDPPAMVSEDFGIFGLPGNRIPTVQFWLGAMNPAKFAAAEAEGKVLPGMHTSHFEPDPEPTLRTGVLGMSSVALQLLRTE